MAHGMQILGGSILKIHRKTAAVHTVLQLLCVKDRIPGRIPVQNPRNPP